MEPKNAELITEQAAVIPIGTGIDAGNFTISVGGVEHMRFCPNGDIFVRGSKVATDLEAYEEARAFFRMCTR